MTIVFVIISSLLFLFIPNTLFAQDTGWVIDSFQTNITVQKDGEVRITETIAVDFNTLEKHGIYRDIPVIYTDSDGSKVYTKVKILSVKLNNSLVKYQESYSNSYLRLKIGDPDKTLSGKQIYKVSYSVLGVLKAFSAYDELYWNITGNMWPIPIKRTTATVDLPQDGITKIKCFIGQSGSEQACLSSEVSSQSATFETEILQENEGLTIVVGIQKNLVAIPTVEPYTLPGEFDLYSWKTILAFFIPVIAGIFYIVWTWWNKGRDFWYRTPQMLTKSVTEETIPIGASETVVVEFTSPENLRPAELGVLIDERADTLDVTATIVDLATRGFVHITEFPKTWLFGKTDFELRKEKKDIESLLPYEKELLDRLFATSDTIQISDLKTKFYDDLAKVKEKLYQTVQSKKLFVSNPESVRTRYLIFGIVIVAICGIIAGIALPNSFHTIGVFAVGAGVAGVFMISVSAVMPRRTGYGRELYRRARGFERFIRSAEKYRQRFYERKNMFNKILPYTIIFGETEKFAKALKDLGIEPSRQATTWYTGHFSSNFVSGASIATFSKSFASAAISTPKGSGFSGGGSSGGGFGGGGGGSW